MKAQILKIAGVKNEKEFYKKFPTEEAFLKKHGKELKKAQVGAMIGENTQPVKPVTPISYSDLYSNATSSVTGISPEEQARQEALASQQAIAASGQQSGGGMGSVGDVLKGIDPSMIASLIGAKNGKKLPKAQKGFEGLIKPPAMPKVGMTNLANTKGFGLTALKEPGESPERGGGYKDALMSLATNAGSLIGGIDQWNQNTKDTAKANMYGKVSDVTLQAASLRPEQNKRRYVRPEDQLTQNFKPLGSGTNYLAAQNGTMIGGNPTEIQNIYNSPNTMYTDLGYEPLNDENRLKQYERGGKMKKAVGGINLDPFAGIGGGLGGALGSATGKGTGKGGPGSAIGSALGGALGTLIPIPGLGSFIGSVGGGFIGGLFDSEQQNEAQAAQDKLNQNLQAAAFQSGTQNLQTQNKAFMEDGGWVSHDWQPQVITTFGEHKVKDLLKPPHDADMLRAGGHLHSYTPPSAAAMYTGRAEDGVQMAMGGDLQVGRGSADTMSYNPYLPGDGETVMFRGPSHDNGGMPVSFGQNGVEVEGGEPAIKMQDGGQQENLVVYGNMPIPDYGVNEINDPKAKGKKFKNYIADLSKQEVKINKSIEKGVKLVNTKDTDDPFDQLAFNSGKAMIMGGNQKLRTIAERKMDTAAVQNGILDTAEEFGVKSDDLAKGKLKMDKDNNMYAEFGKKVKFQGGGKAPLPISLAAIAEALPGSFLPGLSEADLAAKSAAIAKAQDNYDFHMGVSKLPPLQAGPRFDIRNFLPQSAIKQMDIVNPPALPNYYEWDKEIGDYAPGESIGLGNKDKVTVADTPTLSEVNQGVDQGKASAKKQIDPFWGNLLQMGLTSASPFLRPSSDQPLDPATYAPEMYMLSNNQIEPVAAQSYDPLLSQPTSYSLQDQLNEVTAQTRAAERMSAYNPEAASMVAAGAYNARNKILGEQFRMNQAEQQRVAEQNRNVLNDAKLKNLAIYDTQSQRYAEAKSKTKAQALEVMKSVADKIAKNKLENRTLAVYENLFPAYSFTSKGTAYKNPLYTSFFNTLGGIGSNALGGGFGGIQAGGRNLMPTNYDKKGNPTHYKLIGSDDDVDLSRNGSVVKAIKNL